MERLTRVRRVFSYLEVWFNLRHDPDYEPPSDEEFITRIDREAASDNARKQRGFYVDVEHGRVLEPTLIGIEKARQVCDVATQAIGLASLVMTRGSPET